MVGEGEPLTGMNREICNEGVALGIITPRGDSASPGATWPKGCSSRCSPPSRHHGERGAGEGPPGPERG